MNAFSGALAGRSPRERAVLFGGAALVAIAMLVALVWLPLERTRARLAADIPALAASLDVMRKQADEVQRVRPLPAATPATLAPLASLLASGALTRTLPGAQATLADERRLRLSAPDAAYGSLLEALAAAQSVHGLRVQSGRVDALGAPGRVRAEFVLARP